MFRQTSCCEFPRLRHSFGTNLLQTTLPFLNEFPSRYLSTHAREGNKTPKLHTLHHVLQIQYLHHSIKPMHLIYYMLKTTIDEVEHLNT